MLLNLDIIYNFEKKNICIIKIVFKTYYFFQKQGLKIRKIKLNIFQIYLNAFIIQNCYEYYLKFIFKIKCFIDKLEKGEEKENLTLPVSASSLICGLIQILYFFKNNFLKNNLLASK